MNITILGTGPIGGTPGQKWAAAGPGQVRGYLIGNYPASGCVKE